MPNRPLPELTPAPPKRRLFWRDRWADARNRLLGSQRFRLWASRFPITRPIAQRQAHALFDLCAGFVYSQVLYACVQLRVFEILSDGPLDLPALARKLALGLEQAECLVNAAVALNLLEQRDNRGFGLGALGAVLAGNEGIQAMISHHDLLYEDLRDPVVLLREPCRSTRLSQYWPYTESRDPAQLPAEQVSAYSELMAASQSLIAEEVLTTYPMHRHTCLLDVGGGSGAFLAAVARQWPHLRLALFDLPAVAAQAHQRFHWMAEDKRPRIIGGDFHCDPLPAGADIVSLVRVIHDHDDDQVLQLLRKIHQRLPADGTLLLAEPMAGHAATDKVAHAYFGFYLMAMGQGRPRTPANIGSLLQRAGFSRYRLLSNQMPLQTRVMIAKP